MTAATGYAWPFYGTADNRLGRDGQPVGAPVPQAAAHEIVARVDAVSICSSDIKLMRMGARHPLFQNRDLSEAPIVLGHEMALTVCDVGADWQGQYRIGQRLALQPAITRDKQRSTIGIDRAGGFSQFIVLDGHVLDGPEPYVFPVPDEISAASVAMLEPYACVEAAYQPNCRTALLPGGRLLVLGGAGDEGMTLDSDAAPAEATLLEAPRALADWAAHHAGMVTQISAEADLGEAQFDDIILCGTFDAARVERALARLADGGMLVIAAPEDSGATVPADPARIHYRSLSIVGTMGPRIEAAFAPSRNRFDLAPGGTALILGAGGAMGRIHLHRALELPNGPAVIVATSRQAARLDALTADFAALAEKQGRRLIVTQDDALEDLLQTVAPDGCDDVVVVVPDVAAVARGARLMRPSGMLVIFAGTPFGTPCPLPLGHVAAHGARFTGSTGCTVADQQQVMARVLAGDLDLSGNLEAVAGFDALPAAVASVAEGRVAGKIAVFPALGDLQLTPVRDLAGKREGPRWTRADEKRLGVG